MDYFHFATLSMKDFAAFAIDATPLSAATPPPRASLPFFRVMIDMITFDYRYAIINIDILISLRQHSFARLPATDARPGLFVSAAAAFYYISMADSQPVFIDFCFPH